MEEQNCFSIRTAVGGSSDYIAHKKSKAIYQNAANIAKYGGYQQKQSVLGKNNGIYTGDVNISKNKCLLGAKSYNTLFFFSRGKYLVNPPNPSMLMEDVNGL